MIKTEDLTKIFYTLEVETRALDNINMQVNKGEFLAIMGPSGCGKSTLLNILGLLDNPVSGTYYFDGKIINQRKENERTLIRRGNIGFIFQSFNMIDEFTFFENVELPLIYLKIKPSKRKKMVEKNFLLGKKYFSTTLLRKKLGTVVDSIFGEGA